MSKFLLISPHKNDYMSCPFTVNSTIVNQYANFNDVAGFGGKNEESSRMLGTQPFVGPNMNATSVVKLKTIVSE